MSHLLNARFQQLQPLVDVRQWYTKQTLSKKTIFISLPIIILECIVLIQVQRFASEIECLRNTTTIPQETEERVIGTLPLLCYDYTKIALTVALFTIFDLIFVIAAKLVLKYGGFYCCDAMKMSDGLHFSCPLLAPWVAKVVFAPNIWVSLLCLLVTMIMMSLWYRDFFYILRSTYNVLFKYKLLTVFEWNYFNFQDLLYACLYFSGILLYAFHLVYYAYSIPFQLTSHNEPFSVIQFLLHCLFICPFPKLPFSAMLMAIYHACHLLHLPTRQVYCFPVYGNFIAVEENMCLTGKFCRRNSRICKVGQWPPKSRRQIIGFDEDSAIMLTDVNDLPEWIQAKIGIENLHLLESPLDL